MPEIVVRELSVMDEAQWQFGDSKPRFYHGEHGSVAVFDPFPAYAHQMNAVKAAVEKVQECFPPLWNVEMFVADREEEGRSNGFSSLRESGHYGDDEEWVKDDPTGLIVLSGKRVPPHPAVARYLVAHEYGHNVEWMLNLARGARYSHDDTLIKEYAELRGLSAENMHHGSGGRWHNSVHEIFACDFRIIVCGIEPNYWPHAGTPHPDEVDALPAWWAAAVETARERLAERVPE